MKTTLKRSTAAAIALLIIFTLGAVLRAQTESSDNTDNPLQPVLRGDIPDSATFFRLSDYLANDGILGVPWPFLMNTNAAVYSLNNGAFLVDDSSITNDEDLANALLLLAQPQDEFSVRMMSANSLDPGDGGTNSSGGWTNSAQYSSFAIDTNALWAEVLANSLAISNQFAIVLHNTIEDEPYDILTSTNLALPLTNWTVEQGVLGLEGTNITATSLLLNGRPNLFV